MASCDVRRIPIHLDVTDMPVHEAHHELRRVHRIQESVNPGALTTTRWSEPPLCRIGRTDPVLPRRPTLNQLKQPLTLTGVLGINTVQPYEGWKSFPRFGPQSLIGWKAFHLYEQSTRITLS